MNCPPKKRLRGLDLDEPLNDAFNDSFGEDEDYTQDDFNEIDILTSQASTSTAVSGFGSKTGNKPEVLNFGSVLIPSAGQSKPVSKATSSHGRESMGKFSDKTGNAKIPSTVPLGNKQQPFKLDREDSYSLLVTQHADLKRKLREVEEEILLKNGEICVLRDSLKAAQQEKETQRQNFMQLEIQKQKEHSDKEKELSKKVQSMESELQFKEAEINDIKTRLHSSDKSKTASPLSKRSPKLQSCVTQVHHGSGSSFSSPATGFITMEMFGAQVPTTVTPVKKKEDTAGSSNRSGYKQDSSLPDPFLCIRPVHLPHRGGILLGLLLQQPLAPSSLCLSHLLSTSLTDLHLASSGPSAGFLLHTDTAGCRAGAPRTALGSVQNLAISGLSMLSQSHPAAASSKNQRSYPGALLLLPLLEHHLSSLCGALDSQKSALVVSSWSDPLAVGPIPADQASAAGHGTLEESVLTCISLEDAGLATLRLLYLLLSHSDEVLEAVLSGEIQTKVSDKADCSAARLGLLSQNTLLRSVLRLCDIGIVGGSSRREDLVISAVKILGVLMERTPDTQTDKLQCVVQVLCASVSGDAHLRIDLESVSVLLSMCDHPTLAQLLCSQHDPCFFLKLLHFARGRASNPATNTDLVLLDLQVVRLFTRLTQRAESQITSQHSSCQCYTELVQTVVVILHRQWLDLRDALEPTALTDTAQPTRPLCTSPLPWCLNPVASLLRECLQLLHWLLLHHNSFTKSCRPLLHMYDQVIPALRDTLRRIPGLSENEELALEEICRSGDDTDDMDSDGS